ncbi:MAG: YlqD family protein [Bacillota bacterium]
MENIKIMRTIVIKQVVTENFKIKAAAEIQDALKKVETDIENFDKQTKKSITELTLKGHPQINQIKQQIEVEREKLNTYKQQLLEKLKVISKINLNEEVVQGTIDGPVELKLGDNFNTLSKAEIVLKDGILIEIRS